MLHVASITDSSGSGPRRNVPISCNGFRFVRALEAPYATRFTWTLCLDCGDSDMRTSSRRLSSLSTTCPFRLADPFFMLLKSTLPSNPRADVPHMSFRNSTLLTLPQDLFRVFWSRETVLGRSLSEPTSTSSCLCSVPNIPSLSVLPLFVPSALLPRGVFAQSRPRCGGVIIPGPNSRLLG